MVLSELLWNVWNILSREAKTPVNDMPAREEHSLLLFLSRLAAGLASGISYSLYRYSNPVDHITSSAISALFLAAGLALFQILYMLVSRTRSRKSLSNIMTQVAGHYIGTLIIVPS